MNTIFMLVYSSKADVPITPELLKDILTVAREKNLTDNITGFLVERDGYFFQFLEGPEAKVRECYKRIKADTRHRNIILQGEASADTRMMPDWSMGYFDVDPDRTSSGKLIELFDMAHEGKGYSHPESLMGMLRIFTKNAKILEV